MALYVQATAMFILRGASRLLLAALCSFPLVADWRPVDPADLARKQSKIDPATDAEALFREVHILNEQRGASYPQSVVKEYVRLKIFTARGKKFADVQIPYFGKARVYDVQGRTIHPDGSIAELSRDAIFDKLIEKRGYQTRVVSFALPAVEPGSIIEYQFTKNEGEIISRYRHLEVQSDFPVDEVAFFVKPLPAEYYPAMRLMPFGCVPERGSMTNDGYDVIRVSNVPAFHDEPASPPQWSAKQWILIYYEENSKTGKDKYWTSLGKDRYNETSRQIKVNGEIKDLAARLTAGAATDEARLNKLLEYCRTQIKNFNGDEITTAQLDKGKANKTTIDTLRRQQGSSVDISYAFMALAQAAGFDARRADLSDRSTFFFSPAMQSAYFLNSFDIAVNLSGKWRFYDVTNPALPGGQLRWQEQGVYALITDPKQPEMVRTPMLSAADTRQVRLASFTLSEAGVLEGEVREMFFGNYASEWREANRYTTGSQREEQLRDQLKARFADFDLTQVRITASSDPSKPFGVVYHIVVRGYAQRTGKRLFFEPDYFAVGSASRFVESDRHNPVYFNYAWTESDVIDIRLPSGFELDHGDSPVGIQALPTCSYSVRTAFDKTTKTIKYNRELTFGDKEVLMFDQKNYPALKKVFDTVYSADNHILTLKASALSAGVQ